MNNMYCTTKKVERAKYGMQDIIGKLDRSISEILFAAEHGYIDQIDLLTVKHHADDMIGAGQKLLQIVKERSIEPCCAAMGGR